ncbi:MAG: hypothetical protein KJ619_01300 [Candidatus Omnitrophica bacterium]|nr:hypothetical protein [Candidatus Omnitrophota bacterium]
MRKKTLYGSDGIITRHIRGSHEGVKTKVRKIPLDRLRLDRQNVRFRNRTKERELSDKEIHDMVWQEKDTRELYNAIINAGGLREKLFVDEHQVVREGNRRLVCLREIVKDIAAKRIDPGVPLENFTEIECEEPLEGIAPIDMDILLATWHVIGKKPWAKLNQASHLYDMRSVRGLSYDEIARDVGLSKGKVLQACKSLEWTTMYMQEYKVDDVSCWSFFEELYKKKELREWAVSDRLNLEDFFSWVYQKKFPMAIDVRKLPKIILNVDKQLGRDLKKIFTAKNNTIETAWQELQVYDPSLSSDFFKSMKRFRERLNKMDSTDIMEIVKMKAKREALVSLRDKLSEIINKAK